MTLVFTIAWCACTLQGQTMRNLAEVHAQNAHAKDARSTAAACRSRRPLLTIPAGVFSLGYFYFFVILSIIWGVVRLLSHTFCTFMAAVLAGADKDACSLPRNPGLHACSYTQHRCSACSWPVKCAKSHSCPTLRGDQHNSSWPCAPLRLHAQVCAIIGIFLPLWESRDVFARVVGLGGPAPGNATLPKAARSEIQLKTAGDDYAHEGVHTASGNGLKL